MVTRFALIAATFLAVLGSFVSAPYPEEMLLQHVPTMVAIAVLAVVTARCRVSPTSFGCVLAFLWLHVIGARWIYSFVPYDSLANAITGHTISQWFGWQRNHYDRLVHFASGLLGLPIFSELLQTRCRLPPITAGLLAIACVLAVGAIYEIIEWQIAMTCSPAMAESYNGQQGDVWDAQKDLALAWLGSLVCLPMIHAWVPNSVGHRG